VGFGERVIATAIFSCFCPALRDHAKNGIHSVSGIEKLHFNPRYGWGNLGKVPTEVYRILFCGDKAPGLLFISQFEQIANVNGRVLVVVAIELLRDRSNA
jgi:hypothetical protein